MIEPVTKMRIRMIQTAATDRECFVAGREYSVPSIEGQSYVRASLAVEVLAESTETPAKPEKTPKSKPTKGE